MLARAEWQGSAGESVFFRSHRVVTHEQRVWVIRESDASLTPNAPNDHCLVCESALSVRCAWQYPREWSRLTDRELLALFS